MKIHGLTLVVSRDERKDVSVGDGQRTWSSSRVSSTSLLYAIGSIVSDKQEIYRFYDDAQALQERDHTTCSILDEVSLLPRR